MKNLIFALVLVASFQVSGQIYLQNNTKEPVYVCIAMHYDSKGSKYWGSEGWWRVDPGDKKQVSSVIGTAHTIYYYAKAGAKEYAGETRLLVNPSDAFAIKNCDMEYTKKEHPNYVYKKFREVDMKPHLLQRSYTIQLNY